MSDMEKLFKINDQYNLHVPTSSQEDLQSGYVRSKFQWLRKEKKKKKTRQHRNHISFLKYNFSSNKFS